MAFAETLKYERLKRGMTQKEFAELLGVDRPSVAHYENDRIPSPQRVKEFGTILGVDLAKAIIEGGKE